MLFEKKHWIDDSEGVVTESFEVHFGELKDPSAYMSSNYNITIANQYQY
jgi:hypothetical protein